jgi:hypothetical protein
VSKVEHLRARKRRQASVKSGQHQICPKLGITSRAALSDALEDLANDA